MFGVNKMEIRTGTFKLSHSVPESRIAKPFGGVIASKKLCVCEKMV